MMRQVPTGLAVVPRMQHVPLRVPRQRSCAPMSSRQQGQTQAIATLGGAVHDPRGAPTRDIQDLDEDGRVISNAWNIKHLRPFHP
jgi:hypothetical protein